MAVVKMVTRERASSPGMIGLKQKVKFENPQIDDYAYDSGPRGGLTFM